jgi:hypothetical protein
MYNKKIIFGNTDAIITNNEIKTTVINYLYLKLDLSKYRYNILNTIQKLNFLQDNEHYVSPNFKGYNYLLIMMKINDENMCFAIDRKKLSYHKNQLDIKNINIIQISLTVSDTIYMGTIFDGKLIQNKNENIFLIQDCFYLMGNKILEMEMIPKMTHVDSCLKNHFTKPYCLNFEFKINKLYKYNELENLISNLSKLSIQTNGIIFYPKFSGINILYIDKKIDKVDIIEQKIYNIQDNFVEFLKSRVYSYEYNGKTTSMWLTRTTIPDVYNIHEKENSIKLGIALIPNLRISHLCDEIIKDKPIEFNCIYSTKFKKWIPLHKK